MEIIVKRIANKNDNAQLYMRVWCWASVGDVQVFTSSLLHQQYI